QPLPQPANSAAQTATFADDAPIADIETRRIELVAEKARLTDLIRRGDLARVNDLAERVVDRTSWARGRLRGLTNAIEIPRASAPDELPVIQAAIAAVCDDITTE